MHEGAIAAAIIQGALEALEKEKVTAAKTVTVLIGRLHHVVPDVLQNHYRLLKKEYPALRRSRLVIEIAPVAITCRACGKETEIVKPEFACPGCGSTGIDITGGREMHLKEIIGAEAKVRSKKAK
ncbi:MAG: hydrogenase maturation nickel metallochaperone HypA [Acidobacteriota bacterium]|jgi:hydrogenase nickel insertion protein HypA|nr:hydrogenase maturation nickel metallochaperone HypA [Acidobacteriota bacterium]